MYSVIELSKLLLISRQAVYQKIKQHKTALEGHIIIENKRKMITETGLKILQSSMGKNITPSTGDKQRVKQKNVIKFDKFNNVDNAYIELLKQTIERLEQDKKDLIRLLEKEQENNRLYLLDSGKNRKGIFWWLKK